MRGVSKRYAQETLRQDLLALISLFVFVMDTNYTNTRPSTDRKKHGEFEKNKMT